MLSGGQSKVDMNSVDSAALDTIEGVGPGHPGGALRAPSKTHECPSAHSNAPRVAATAGDGFCQCSKRRDIDKANQISFTDPAIRHHIESKEAQFYNVVFVYF